MSYCARSLATFTTGLLGLEGEASRRGRSAYLIGKGRQVLRQPCKQAARSDQPAACCHWHHWDHCQLCCLQPEVKTQSFALQDGDNPNAGMMFWDGHTFHSERQPAHHMHAYATAGHPLGC